MSYFYTDELSHHGILGQKWGVRRFENSNGRLTAAGKARYDDGKVSEKEKHAFSAKAAAYKTLGGMHAINAKFSPTKSGRQLAKAAGKIANKKAEQYQKEADERAANKKGLSDGQKKALKIGAAVTATALASYGVYKVSQINKKPKPFTTEQLKSMGINVFEPERIEVNRIQLNRTPVNITSSKPIKTVTPSASSVSKANESLQATLNMMKNISSSTPASSGQNDLVYDLLKKNSATLSSLGF